MGLGLGRSRVGLGVGGGAGGRPCQQIEASPTETSSLSGTAADGSTSALSDEPNGGPMTVRTCNPARGVDAPAPSPLSPRRRLTPASLVRGKQTQDYAQIWRDRVSPFVLESVEPKERQRQVAIVELLETWRLMTRELETFLAVRAWRSIRN